METQYKTGVMPVPTYDSESHVVIQLILSNLKQVDMPKDDLNNDLLQP